MGLEGSADVRCPDWSRRNPIRKLTERRVSSTYLGVFASVATCRIGERDHAGNADAVFARRDYPPVSSAKPGTSIAAIRSGRRTPWPAIH